MANTAKKNSGLCFGDLTPHELDVLLAYRTKLETHQGVDMLLGIEGAREANIPVPIINVGYAINRVEDFYDQFSKMMKRIAKMDAQVGDYMKRHANEFERCVVNLRKQYNCLFKEV